MSRSADNRLTRAQESTTVAAHAVRRGGPTKPLLLALTKRLRRAAKGQSRIRAYIASAGTLARRDARARAYRDVFTAFSDDAM